ncbi:MAG: aldehyde dehydrogenase family protein [Rhodococcus sp. (in: high G+C Gram-positive bacteria)]|nr:MAG: aldehyde dehydrogenase family protein [Rhodococcus sp. (in: high G+C Gram-positive bacteria)]
MAGHRTSDRGLPRIGRHEGGHQRILREAPAAVARTLSHWHTTMRQQTMNELVSINPATLEEIGRIPITTEEELDQAVRNADSALAQGKTDRAYRQELLQSCALELTRKNAEIGPLLVMEQGKTTTEAGGEMWISAKNFTHAAQID